MAPASSERSPSLEPRADLGQTSHEGGWLDNKCDRRCLLRLKSRRARRPASAAPQRALGQFALLVGLQY